MQIDFMNGVDNFPLCNNCITFFDIWKCLSTPEDCIDSVIIGMVLSVLMYYLFKYYLYRNNNIKNSYIITLMNIILTLLNLNIYIFTYILSMMLYGLLIVDNHANNYAWYQSPSAYILSISVICLVLIVNRYKYNISSKWINAPDANSVNLIGWGMLLLISYTYILVYIFGDSKNIYIINANIIPGIYFHRIGFIDYFSDILAGYSGYKSIDFEKYAIAVTHIMHVVALVTVSLFIGTPIARILSNIFNEWAKSRYNNFGESIEKLLPKESWDRIRKELDDEPSQMIVRKLRRLCIIDEPKLDEWKVLTNAVHYVNQLSRVLREIETNLPAERLDNKPEVKKSIESVSELRTKVRSIFYMLSLFKISSWAVYFLIPALLSVSISVVLEGTGHIDFNIYKFMLGASLIAMGYPAALLFNSFLNVISNVLWRSNTTHEDDYIYRIFIIAISWVIIALMVLYGVYILSDAELAFKDIGRAISTLMFPFLKVPESSLTNELAPSALLLMRISAVISVAAVFAITLNFITLRYERDFYVDKSALIAIPPELIKIFAGFLIFIFATSLIYSSVLDFTYTANGAKSTLYTTGGMQRRLRRIEGIRNEIKVDKKSYTAFSKAGKIDDIHKEHIRLNLRAINKKQQLFDLEYYFANQWLRVVKHKIVIKMLTANNATEDIQRSWKQDRQYWKCYNYYMGYSEKCLQGEERQQEIDKKWTKKYIKNDRQYVLSNARKEYNYANIIAFHQSSQLPANQRNSMPPLGSSELVSDLPTEKNQAALLSFLPYSIFLAIIGALLTVATRDLLENYFAGLSLKVNAPFEENDRITVGNSGMSEVHEIGLRTTILYGITNNTHIHIPHKKMAQEVIENFTQPTLDYRRNVIIFVFDSNDQSPDEKRDHDWDVEAPRCAPNDSLPGRAEALLLVSTLLSSGVKMPVIEHTAWSPSNLRNRLYRFLGEISSTYVLNRDTQGEYLGKYKDNGSHELNTNPLQDDILLIQEKLNVKPVSSLWDDIWCEVEIKFKGLKEVYDIAVKEHDKSMQFGEVLSDYKTSERDSYESLFTKNDIYTTSNDRDKLQKLSHEKHVTSHGTDVIYMQVSDVKKACIAKEDLKFAYIDEAVDCIYNKLELNLIFEVNDSGNNGNNRNHIKNILKKLVVEHAERYISEYESGNNFIELLKNDDFSRDNIGDDALKKFWDLLPKSLNTDKLFVSNILPLVRYESTDIELKSTIKRRIKSRVWRIVYELNEINKWICAGIMSEKVGKNINKYEISKDAIKYFEQRIDRIQYDLVQEDCEKNLPRFFKDIVIQFEKIENQNMDKKQIENNKVCQVLLKLAEHSTCLSFHYFALAELLWRLKEEESSPTNRRNIDNAGMALLNAPRVLSNQRRTIEGDVYWEMELDIVVSLAEQSDEIIHHINRRIDKFWPCFNIIYRHKAEPERAMEDILSS